MALHVWLIEDDIELGDMTGRQLVKNDVRVTRFSDGRSALERLDRIDDLPDVVCLDLALPDISGFEVCARLRADERTARVPILVVTARTSLEDRARADEVGADAYLEKPFRLKAFVAEVQRLAARQRDA